MHSDASALGGDPTPSRMTPMLAADIQDHLLVATNDLERLQRLIADASEALMANFFAASSSLETLESHCSGCQTERQVHLIRHAREQVRGAITAMQFQDLATQLLDHTSRRMRRCADKLAVEAMGGEDEDGLAVVEEAPLRPNPVTQDEVDAGSIELF